MGAYKCPACRGNDIADGASNLHCLGCGADLQFAPGPTVVLVDPDFAPVDAEPAGSRRRHDPEPEPEAVEVEVEAADPEPEPVEPVVVDE